MAAPAPKPKFTKFSVILYIVIGILITVGGLVAGTAMDFCMEHGKVNFAKFGSTLPYVFSHPGYVFQALHTKGSYSGKLVFLGLAALGIFIVYKWAEDPKRTHRKGVEHGSAKWGNQKEMQALADKDCTYYSPKKSTAKQLLMMRDGEYLHVDGDRSKDYLYAIVDNNILFSEEVKLSLNAKQHLLNHNVLIVGGSGSGKTRFYAKPNTMQMNTSYVITDPKGEILQTTGKMLEAAGYKVRVFNLIEMAHSNNYNPFEYVYDYDGNLSADNIKKMVRVLFESTKGDGEKTDFWAQKGQSLLEAIVYLLFEESEYSMERDADGKLIPETRDKSHLNFFSVTEKMRKLRYPPKGSKQPDGFFLEQEPDEEDGVFLDRQYNKSFLCPLDKDFLELKRRKGETLAYRLYKEVRNAPEETGQSFLSSANVKTFMFNMPNLRNLTCCDNIHLETLGDEKTALYVIISATDSTYNFMAAMMYTQMFDVLANRANFKYKSNGQRLPVPVRCIMDEFSNIGQIPDFEKVIAFVRSMGMSLNVIVQNIAQLKAKYEKTWEVITGNCDTLLFLGGKEESTLKYISESLGKETIDIRGVNKSKGKESSTSENNSIMGRELMQPNEISSMPISDCLVMIRSHNPFYCHKYPIEKHPNYQFLGDDDPQWQFDVSEVHSVTVEEFEASCQRAAAEREKARAEEMAAGTDVPLDADGGDKDKAVTVFEISQATVTADPIQPGAEPPVKDISQSYGEPKNPPETVDLGEPIEPVEEVISDVDDAEERLRDLETFYADPPEEAEHFETIPDAVQAKVSLSAFPAYELGDPVPFENGA